MSVVKISFPRTKWFRHLRRLLGPNYIPSIIALAVVVTATFFAEQQNASIADMRARTMVSERLTAIRSKLERSINGDVQLVRGLAAMVAAEPDISETRFAALSKSLFDSPSHLHNLALAPDLVIRQVYPRAGNEAALGHDYRKSTTQREAALRARDENRMVLAGPVDLIQGGRGLVSRFPIRVDDDKGGSRFWGILSAVIDIDAVYDEAGLTSSGLDLDVALSGRDGLGAGGALFFGEAAVLGRNPVSLAVALPGGSWVINGTPKGGWAAEPPNAWAVRLAVALGSLLILVPVYTLSRLMDERQENIRILEQKEERLGELSRRLRIALDASETGIWELDVARETLVWDKRMHEIYAAQPHETADMTFWADRLHPEDRQGAIAEIVEASKSRRTYHSQFRIVLPDGRVRNIRSIGSCFTDAKGQQKVVGVNWDISADVAKTQSLEEARRLAEERNREIEAARHRMEFNALHDPLTGLPNRRFLDQRLNALTPCGTPISVFHLDLDRFKDINDTLGHAAGDEVLRHAADTLRARIRPGDFVARIGGDEFVVIAANDSLPDEGKALAAGIIEAMRTPVPYRGHECRIGASIGIARQSSDEETAAQLLVNADIALYEAKRSGRDRYQFFTPALRAAALKTKKTGDEILRALERGEIIAYFQPQFSPVSLDIIGVEALARWQHPTRGLLAPAAFLETAEAIGVVAKIDDRVLDCGLEVLRLWDEAGLAIPKLSVNLSHDRLNDQALPERLEARQLPRGRLSFELLESISFDETDSRILSNIERIRDLGIDLEIDDFGSGYASITSLLKLKPSRLKIDRQLVMPILSSNRQLRLVSSIIDIGRALGIDVIAEGVETRNHADVLRALGAHALQGYAFARPMSAEMLVDFASRKTWKAA
ncbi:histidine kinase [Xaviernesmea oryzae]|uniref:Histidine kinase n=1 Tax=Xaviernesmea oryzae TaxID=464029 RepID=A0A1Q9AZ32_9HYPH|nr:EAL domain-containing protein [Xaviernesmea oryzae]OLP60966.1 histidine kinase [Xaviernesmea oryzae]SEL19788.1 diguanylate cyclase (GGDEF) domain-containing protein [Xaviernesmea oryzae]